MSIPVTNRNLKRARSPASLELSVSARENSLLLRGWRITACELSGYTVICCSNCSARCCVSVGVVTIWKAGEAAFVPRVVQVLHTTVARS